MPYLKGVGIDNFINVDKQVRFLQTVQLYQTTPWATNWFVDGTNGLDGDTGKSPESAKLTLQAAVTAASEGDVIYVRPKGAATDASDFDYYEDGSVTVPYAAVNLSIIGVTRHAFKPYYGPWLRHGNGASDTGYVLLNYAPGLCLENMGFQANSYIRTTYGAVSMYASSTGGAYTTHAGSVAFTIHNCFFRDGQLNINGGYDGVVHGSTFEASGTSNTGVWSTDNGLPTGGHRILSSRFNEMFADNQPLRYIYFVAGQQVNFYINDCYFGLVPADGHYMWFGTSNAGQVSNCYFRHAGVSIGTNDTSDELYSADGGVVFSPVYDTTCGIVGGA